MVDATIGSRMATSLHDVLILLSDTDAENDRAACEKLTSLRDEIRVHEQRGEITREQGAQLQEATEALQRSAGCGS